MSAVTFEALEQLQTVHDFLDAFEKATGVRLELVRCQSVLSPPCPPLGRREPSVLDVPLLIGGQHLATFLAVAAVYDRRRGPTKNPRALSGHGPPLQLSERQLQGLQRLVAIFSEQLSDFASRHLIANGKHDPPSVTRAKQFINERVTDRLTLGAVACHAGLSVDHFRKVFRKAAEMPFTDYVARARVEKAKEMIANPTIRIGDVAFASGFQSLPYFSRVFKRHTRESEPYSCDSCDSWPIPNHPNRATKTPYRRRTPIRLVLNIHTFRAQCTTR